MIALTRKEKLIILKVYFLVLGLIAVLGWGFDRFGSVFWEMIVFLLIGWFCLPFRVLGSSLGGWLFLAVLGLVVLVGPVHLGLSWLYMRIKKPNMPKGMPTPRWQSRWTIAWFSLVLLFMLSGAAMLGLVLNAYWMAVSDNSLIDKY